MLSDFAVLVLSCDKYSDIWDPLFRCFRKAWPNCPYPVYLGANEKTFDAGQGVTTLLSGEDKDWSTSCATILGQIPERWIWLLVDDLFLVAPVNQTRLEEAVNFMWRYESPHVHVLPLPTPPERRDGLGFYPKGMPYRVNLHGLWRKQYLEQLLLPGESAWDFEIMGSYRSAYDDGFYCLLEPFTASLNMIEKGRWIPDSYERFQRLNIANVVSDRTMFTAWDEIVRRLKVEYFKVVMHIPWRWRTKAMHVLRRLLISY